MDALDRRFYSKLAHLQQKVPKHYRMSGLPVVVYHKSIDDYVVQLPQLEVKAKADDGNANTRDRYMGILLKEFNNPVEKLENYRILYRKIAELYDEGVADTFLDDDIYGLIYTHNSQNISTKPYCFAYDFDQLVQHGAFFTDIADRPARHLDSFLQHVIELVAVTCRETTGAVGMPALFPYMWYFWNKDIKSGYCHDPYGYLKQQIQMLVYKLNGSEMRMNESAFTNVSIMDESYLDNFFGDRLFPDGEAIYDHISEIIDLECFFLECVNDILASKIMTFPVITDCLLYDAENSKFVNEDTARRFNALNMRWNNANMYCGTDISTLSTCCRVLNNVDTMNQKLTGFTNFIGGSDLNIGSVAVMTINLPHIMLLAHRHHSGSFTYFENTLATVIKDVCKYLHAVREVIKDLIAKKALKLYDRQLARIERQFNTIGFIGMYDAAILADRATNEEVLSFERDILETFKAITSNFDSDQDYSINIEQIPGESACVKLAQKDKIFFDLPDEAIDCYSNQWLPLSEYFSIQTRAEFASVLDKLCGGGSILHLNIDSPFVNQDQSWELLNFLAKQGVIYFAFNNKISVCEKEHGFYGEECWCGRPKVGEATRPVGFITLVKNWIPSRQKEYETRKWEDLNQEV